MTASAPLSSAFVMTRSRDAGANNAVRIGLMQLLAIAKQSGSRPDERGRARRAAFRATDVTGSVDSTPQRGVRP